MKRLILHSPFFVLLILVLLGAASPAAGQESLTLEVAPPLFRVSIAPGGEWNSQLKVVNPNPFPITVAPRLADYEPFDDRPGGELITREGVEGAERFSASLWTDIPQGLVTIAAESSRTLPLSLNVPKDAEPGTHTAAIVVGNVPVSGEGRETKISTNVTSLLVVTVLGDVTEAGGIRTFATEKKTYKAAEAGFILAFENTGNVHLEPKGDIVIKNIWGRERGRVPIEVEEDLRLILPNTFKEFRFVWQGGQQGFDIGPYRATASVNYGEGDGINDTAKIWFWVIPWQQLSVVSIALILAVLLLAWSVRSFVMRVILREAMSRRVSPFGSFPAGAHESMRRGAVVDLRDTKPGDLAKQGSEERRKEKGGRRRKFGVMRIATVLAGVLTVGIAIIYGMSALTNERDYRIALPGEDGPQIVGQDELFELTQPEPVSGSDILTEETGVTEDEVEVAIEVKILVQNGSGIAGRAGEVAELLKQTGFTTVSSENADRFDYQRTIIRYKKGRGAIAEAIKELLSSDPIIEEREDLPEEVVVILGKDSQ